MDLAELAAEGRHADGVLEQAPGVRMVAVRRRRIRLEGRLRQGARDDPAERVVMHLRDEELEESLELARVAAQARRESRRIDSLGRLECPHLDLQLVAKALDAAEHVDRVARLEASVEQVDVVPDPRADAAARVHELEREIRRAVARPQPLLPRDRVDALNGAVFLEFCDRGHEREFRMAGYRGPMRGWRLPCARAGGFRLPAPLPVTGSPTALASRSQAAAVARSSGSWLTTTRTTRRCSRYGRAGVACDASPRRRSSRSSPRSRCSSSTVAAVSRRTEGETSACGCAGRPAS